jgi:hypothetical protein
MKVKVTIKSSCWGGLGNGQSCFWAKLLWTFQHLPMSLLCQAIKEVSVLADLAFQPNSLGGFDDG